MEACSAGLLGRSSKEMRVDVHRILSGQSIYDGIFADLIGSVFL